MAYAIDTISESFHKTKKLFFPIRVEYWLKMGFISLLGSNSAGNFSNTGSSSRRDFPADISITEFISELNTKALNFLSQYGFLVAIVFLILYGISLLFTYINSIFMFMFVDGLIKKSIMIRKSFKKNRSYGVSLFFIRFIVGIISFFVISVIFLPLIYAFFTNSLTNFNLWLLIPMFLGFLLYLLILSIFLFLVYDFVVPIMYLKKYSFLPAWNYFKKIASKKKLEIVIYWLVKLGLGIGIGVVGILLFIPLLIVLILIAIPFVVLGVAIFFIMKFLGEGIAIAIIVLYGIMVFILFLYFIIVVYVPFPAFFRIYSIEMLRKLESFNKS